jgi:hypothetical protein
MSLWKDYDETPPEISASLFQKKNPNSHLNHSMFTAAASLFSRNDENNKNRKSLFQEKVQISNGVNLFEDNEPDIQREILIVEEVTLDPFEKLEKSSSRVKQLDFFSMESDGESESDDNENLKNGKKISSLDLQSSSVIKKQTIDETTTEKNGINYQQLYEEELYRRLEYEKQIEKLTKQVQILTKQLQATELLKKSEERDGDLLNHTQENITLTVTADDRKNMQLNRLKKSSGGNKKKNKVEQPTNPSPTPVATPVNETISPVTHTQEGIKNKIPSTFPKQETPSSTKFFTESESDDETFLPPQPILSQTSQGTNKLSASHLTSQNNLWSSSSDEEDEEMMTSSIDLKTPISEDDLKETLEREKIEKQKARQRQLNQRNRRGGSTVSKRRGVSSNGNSSKPSPSEVTVESETLIPETKQPQETIPRTAGHTWSDDEDDDEEEEPTIAASVPLHHQTTSSSPSSIILLSESSIDHIVMSWCQGKDLLAMIQTLQEVPSMSYSTTEMLITLQSQNIYSLVRDPSDVRKIYL